MTMTLQELSDREEIRILMATLAQAGDIRDMPTYMGAFTADGTLELPIFKATGRDNMERVLTADPDARAKLKAVRHNITSSKITFTSDTTAEGRSYFIVYYGVGPDHMGHYADQFKKVDDVWELAYRKVNFDWISDTSRAAPTEELRNKMLSWAP
ncbi:MAG: hypothetical protein JWO33_2618 [Caulobacteraceae bacterium]|nr:hypothetical protein [Caulobacteraceae bacterium]